MSEGPRLPKSEWVHLIPEHPGIVRAPHESPSCSGGSRSLRIQKREDGSSVARCYRCGAWGTESPSGHYTAPVRLSGHQDTGKPRKVPSDRTSNLDVWPAEAKAWLAKSGVAPDAALEMGAAWSPSSQSLLLPVWQEGPEVGEWEEVGWVVRGFAPKRYHTIALAPDRFWGHYRAHQRPQEAERLLVVVEDLVSAWRASWAGADALALLSTHLPPSAVAATAAERYDRVVVFLDGDNAGVRRQARSIARTLSFAPQVQVVETGEDPKHHTEAELRSLLSIGGRP